MILLTSEEIQKAKQFAIDVTETTFDIYKARNFLLTKEKCIDDALMGKLGEQATYNYLVENGYYPSKIDYSVKKIKHHGADIEIIGKNVLLHVKTCNKSFLSWVFEKNAQYVKKPSPSDFICLVVKHDYDSFRIESIRQSSEHEFLPTIKPMSSKLAIYL